MLSKYLVGEHLLYTISYTATSRSEVSGFADFIRISAEVTLANFLPIFGYNQFLGILHRVRILQHEHNANKSLN